MAISQQVSQLLLQYAVDQQSVAAVLATERTVQVELDKTAKTSMNLQQVYGEIARAQANAVRTQGVDALTEAWRRDYRETNSVLQANLRMSQSFKDLGASVGEIERVTQAVARLRLEEEKRGGFRQQFLGGQTARTIGQQLRAIPGGGPTETLGRLAPILDAILDVKDQAPGASKGLLAFAGGLAAIGVAAQLVVGRINAVTEAVKAEAKARYEAQRAGILASDQANKDRIAQIERETAAVKVTFERAEAELSAARKRLYESFIATGTRTPNADTRNILGAIAEERGITAQYDEERKKAEALRIEHEELTRVLESGANKAAEARAALDAGIALQATTAESRQKEIDAIDATINSINALYLAGQLNEDQQSIALAQLDDLVAKRAILADTTATVGDELARLDTILDTFNSTVQRTIDIQGMDAEERADRIGEIQREINTWQSFREGLADTDKRAIAADEAMQLLNSELLDLQATTSTNADVLNHLNGVQDSLKDSTQNYLDGLTEAGEAFEEAVKQWADAQAEAEAKLADLRADRDRKLEDAVEDANVKQDKLNRKREKDELKALENYNERVAKINKKANADIENAIYARDALAAYKAAQKRDEEIAEEDEQYKDRLELIKDSYQEQTDDIGEALQRQLDDIHDAYRRQRQAVRDRLRDEEAAYRQAEQQRQVALNNSLRQLDALQQASQQNSILRTNNYYQTMSSIEDVYLNNMAFRFGAFFGQVLGMFPTAGSGGGGAGPGGGGGPLATPTSALRGGGERAMIPTRASGAGGITINIPIAGSQMTKRDIKRLAAQELSDTLDRAGWM